MKYIDIHCHLDSRDYDSDREEVLARMREKEVGAIIIGTDLKSSKRAVEIAESNENVWATIGAHPVKEIEVSHGAGPETSLNVREVETNSPGELFNEKEFEKLAASPKVVGIGECGLDYFGRRSLGEGGLSEENKKAQKKLFESQIRFAIKHDKPLMLHVRNAYEDIFDILENYKKDAGEKLRGNVHFFAGDVSVAKKFLDLGFTMSFTGVITFLPRRSFAEAGAHDYNEVIKYIPQNSIMSETDAPFIAPVPYRGKRNEPAYVIEVVKKMAEIRGENADTLNRAIINNAKRVFSI